MLNSLFIYYDSEFCGNIFREARSTLEARPSETNLGELGMWRLAREGWSDEVD